jgi:hypothetical protein
MLCSCLLHPHCRSHPYHADRILHGRLAVSTRGRSLKAKRLSAPDQLRRSRDPGAEGNAMLARPHKDVPIAFLSADTLEAALTRQFADSHLIDRMWDAGQLNDWQYATANKLLQLCDDTGMLSSKVALIGRIGGSGHGEMSDAMAAAWKNGAAAWKKSAIRVTRC